MQFRLMSTCIIFFLAISRKSQRNGDYLRAEFHGKASLWISVVALILGGFCWAIIVSIVLLRLKGFEFGV